MPPAAASTAARRPHANPRRAAAAIPGRPRRVSGPSKQARTRGSAAPRPLGFRVIETIHRLSEHRLVDRLVRGRAWIAIVGIGLIGIVFMQVSMLQMNTRIGGAVQRSAVLERQNAALQAKISHLSSSERIRDAAARAGMIPAIDATENFLDASSFSMRRAVNGITTPSTNPQPVTTSPTSPLAASAAAAESEAQTAAPATAGTAVAANPTTTAAAVTGTATATATPTPATATMPATGTTPATGTAPTGAASSGAATRTPTPQPNPPATVAGGAAATGP